MQRGVVWQRQAGVFVEKGKPFGVFLSVRRGCSRHSAAAATVATPAVAAASFGGGEGGTHLTYERTQGAIGRSKYRVGLPPCATPHPIPKP